MKHIISKRRLIHGFIAFSSFLVISYFNISLLYVVLFGSLIGIVFGKVFCRWMCPLGFLMETFIKSNPNQSQQQLYNYHKLGCPIAWISGYLNRFSIFKIVQDPEKCISCGKCDKTCYISSLNSDFSIFKKNKKKPSKHFSCSKCLECVEKCPVDSISYKI